jgi:hypothetical protein
MLRSSRLAYCPVCGRGGFDWVDASVHARAVLFAAMSDDPTVPDPEPVEPDDDPDDVDDKL